MDKKIVMKYHLHLDISGYLKTAHEDGYKDLLRYPDGSFMLPKDAKAALVEALVEGYTVLPIGESCQEFDYRGGGCPGHRVIQEQSDGTPETP